MERNKLERIHASNPTDCVDCTRIATLQLQICTLALHSLSSREPVQQKLCSKS
jgi:hypothetical protein